MNKIKELYSKRPDIRFLYQIYHIYTGRNDKKIDVCVLRMA